MAYLKKLLNIFGVYAMNQGVNNAQDVFGGLFNP